MRRRSLGLIKRQAAGGGLVGDLYDPDFAWAIVKTRSAQTRTCELIRDPGGADETRDFLFPDEYEDGTLATWAGSSTVLVNKLYDDNSGVHLEQQTGSPSHNIVISGTIQTDSGGNLQIDASSGLLLSGVLNGGSRIATASVFCQAYYESSSGGDRPYGLGEAAIPYLNPAGDASVKYGDGRDFGGLSVPLNTRFLRTTIFDPSTIKDYFAGVENFDLTNTRDFPDQFGLGDITFSDQDTKLYGALLWLSDQSANQSDIESAFDALYS